jgi:hypothetical protein
MPFFLIGVGFAVGGLIGWARDYVNAKITQPVKDKGIRKTQTVREGRSRKIICGKMV